MRSETQTTSLSDREVKLLQILAQSVGESVDYREILSAFNLSDGSRTALTDWVRRLRKKIEPDPKNPTVLLRHYGGRFELHTSTSEPAEPAPQTLVKRLGGTGSVYRTHLWAANPGASVIKFGRPCRRRKNPCRAAVATQAIASGRFIDGVIFCELAACTNVSDALYALASPGGFFDDQHTVKDAVQSRGRRSRVGVERCVWWIMLSTWPIHCASLSALYRGCRYSGY